MANTCKDCGRKEPQIIAAKTLGLLEEFQSGIYTCCQISQWADEQSRCWFEATRLDGGPVDDLTGKAGIAEAETVLVPVRLRRPQVPWHRNLENPA